MASIMYDKKKLKNKKHYAERGIDNREYNIMKEKHNQLCRLCAESKSGLVGIYKIEGRTLKIESKIAKCLHIQVFLDDLLPLSVCHECCTLLNICNDFYEKANDAQCNLHDMLVSKETSQSRAVSEVKSNSVEKTGDTSKGETIEVEVDLVPEEIADDEEYSDSGNNDTGERDQISQTEVKDGKDNDSKSATENGSLNQNNKKKVKRKSSSNETNENAKKAKYCGTNDKRADGNPLSKREMGPGCDSSCRFKCQTKVTYEERVQLFEEFWNIGNHSLQWRYIDKMLHWSEPQNRTEQQKNVEGLRKKFSYHYFLDLGTKKQKVCQTMFLDTFDISGAWIRTIAKKKINGEFTLSDMRGKHNNKPKRIPVEIRNSVDEHIRSFPKIKSHCCGESIQREYLDATLNIKKMYTMYKSWMESTGRKEIASEHCYRDTFNNSYDLSFHRPKKDQCELYIEHKFRSDERKQKQETHDVKDSQNLMDQSSIPEQQSLIPEQQSWIPEQQSLILHQQSSIPHQQYHDYYSTIL
ncbi:uncharacterized protein LOC100680066 isoform X2 [Nasonia vitripennis]|uniref:ZAD domain-containing protein n=1 Tax=Nasonia vitripennis TaxID=7425 RepID=A0A7M7GDT2_NASVI|nr:uncharacterized protein LOC100680066 isoform X2 [Nasonia vitripennis]XP_031784648.1 uncharacterized protein LOC100680066 isoform X2 [Nasonia vitripennis]XP_032455457.1 uncharacterized protein LOC100680066 isoform X2 [Nasonia vitripennis]XP_032455458.1 uncharacterized protein LOC100680066 isoform X2 [Nasonia vitripennis]